MLELLHVATGVRAGPRGGGQDLVLNRDALIAVADGLGPKGGLAARAALDALADGVDHASPALETAFQAAQDAARATGERTTLAAAVVDPTLTMHIGHIGAVRALLLRHLDHALPTPVAPLFAPTVTTSGGATLVSLTRDHSIVCDMVERGHLSPEAAREHALRGRLTRVLGADLVPQPGVRKVRLFPGDVVLIVSDGLLDALSPAEIAETLGRADDARLAVESLLTAAARAADDVAIALLRVALEPDEAKPGPDRRPSARREPPPAEAAVDSITEFGRDLTRAAEAGELDPVIGRDDEVLAIARAIVSRKKPNAVLVGPAGVGKTAIVEGFAQKLAEGSLSPALRGKRLVEISMSTMLAGTKYRGDFEKRLRGVIDAAEADPDLILFVDELHTVMGAGDKSGGAGDASQVLKPALSRGALRMIGATTTAEYQRHIATDAAFERRFTVVRVEEPSEAHADAILRGLRARFESHYGVTVADEALVAAVRLSARHVHDRHLPDKAIELIDQACARLVVPGPSSAGKSAPRGVSREHVVTLLAQRQGVDPQLLAEDLPAARERMAELDDFLGAHILGQVPAVSQVARAIRRSYGGLKDPRRPVATFLFVGPTGVGKTETAKVLCEFLFGDRERLLRVDMSEYGERHSVSRLLGSPPGYIGHDEEGQLTGPMHLLPQRVVLLDEIEKAHPDVLLLLLQLLDEGTLTDTHGRRASFRESVIVLTSNLIQELPGAKRIGFRAEAEVDAEAEAESRDDDALRAELARALRPEFVGRIGEVVMFRRLTEEAARGIAELTATRMLDRLRQQGVELSLPPDLIDDAMAELGSLDLGARVLERILSDKIGALLETPRISLPAPPPALTRRELTIVAAAPSASSTVERLAVRARTGSWGPELIALGVQDTTIVAVLASAKPALSLALALAGDATCVVHRGRVSGLDEGAPAGATVATAELVLELLREDGTHALVLTGSAARALGPETALHRTQIGGEMGALIEALELYELETP